MKLLKSIAVLSLASLVAFNANAAEPQNVKQPVKQTVSKEDKNLEQFNQNVKIRLVQRGFTNENNQPVVILVYEVENIGKRAIRSVNWQTILTHNNQAILAYNIPAKFEKALARKAKTNVTLTLPVAVLPQVAQPVLTNKESSVAALAVAQELVLSNGKKIVVK